MTSLKEIQLDLIQQILDVQNLRILKDLQARLHQHTLQEMEEADDYIEPSGVPFEVWNAQFGDAEKMQEFQADLGMTLGEFRRLIWEAEQSEEFTYEEYLEQTKNWFQ